MSDDRLDERSDRPLYRQLADVLRRQIEAGEIAPQPDGTRRLPSETQLGQRYGLARPAVRAAIDVLRIEWRVITSRRGYGTRVRESVEREAVELPAGASASVRPATEDERADLGIDEIMPVVEIRLADDTTMVYAADRIRLTRP